MNRNIKILLVVLAFCSLSNFFPLSFIFHFFTNEGYYQYSNYNGSNTTEQGLFKGGDFGRIERIHQSWVDENPNAPDKKLYRVFWRNPLAFWRWRSYFFDKRYDLPYKDKDEIIAVRKKYKGNLKRYHTAF